MKTFFKKIVALLLRLEARAVLRKYEPHVVAITGSVGKTSTKDAVFSVVAQGTHARKSEKSFNSEIGLPLAILGRPNAWSNPFLWVENLIDGLFLILARAKYPKWLVLEVGADRPGDIRSVSKWLRVDVVVITRLPEVPVHVEFFDSPEAVIEEKASLLRALKNSGTLVLYGDDPNTRALAERAPGKKVITFGLREDNDVRAEHISIVYESGKHPRPIGLAAQVVVGGERAPIEVLGTVGAHALLPALAALAVSRALGKDLPGSLEALRTYSPPLGRMHLIPGIKETTIIDDTYNSSPAAVFAALEALELSSKKPASTRGESTRGGRKIAVLGDMLELGRHSVEEHRKVGAYVKGKADIIITAGVRARDIVQGALDQGMKDAAIFQHDDVRRAGAELQSILKTGDTVLIKGSQSMRMERIVEEIMAEPERAGELLVRQDEEWRKRR